MLEKSTSETIFRHCLFGLYTEKLSDVRCQMTMQCVKKAVSIEAQFVWFFHTVKWDKVTELCVVCLDQTLHCEYSCGEESIFDWYEIIRLFYMFLFYLSTQFRVNISHIKKHLKHFINT